MQNKTSMTIRTDSKIKSQAQHLFADLGLDLSTAINLFLRQSIKHQGLPFEVTLLVPNSLTEEAINDTKLNGSFESVSDLMRSLDA